jgi:hypothetical protein
MDYCIKQNTQRFDLSSIEALINRFFLLGTIKKLYILCFSILMRKTSAYGTVKNVRSLKKSAKMCH